MSTRSHFTLDFLREPRSREDQEFTGCCNNKSTAQQDAASELAATLSELGLGKRSSRWFRQGDTDREATRVPGRSGEATGNREAAGILALALSCASCDRQNLWQRLAARVKLMSISEPQRSRQALNMFNGRQMNCPSNCLT